MATQDQAPSSAGAAPASAPSPGTGGTPSPPVPAPSPSERTEPLPDWQSRYSELEGQYNRYKQYGDPEVLGQTVAWARQVAKEIQDGKLTYAQQRALERDAAQTDPYQGWDELDPRQQADRLVDLATRKFTEQVKPEVDKMGARLEEWQKGQLAREQIALHAMRLAQQNPDVAVEDLIAEAARLHSLPPTELMNMALAGKVSPKRMEAEIERRVNEKLAAQKADQENSELQLLQARPNPRLERISQTKNPLERRRQEEMSLMDRLRAAKRSA